MALTGLAWCGFLVGHFAGNLFLYGGEKPFMAYVEAIESKKELVYVAEIVLIILLATHLISALRVTMDNRNARPVAYAVRGHAGGSTLASRSMLLTGGIILVFMVLHIMTFKFGMNPGENLYQNVIRRFSWPPYSLFYVFAVSMLGLHVSHGVQSAFHTLGLNHPKYTPLIKKMSCGFGVFIAVGFGAFPIYFMCGGQP